MIWVEFAKKYLGAFAAKDLDALDGMYADNVELHDWAVKVKGKEEVLSVNKAFFNSTGLVSIHIQNTAYRDKYITVEFVLVINSLVPEDNTVINVVDVIEIDDYGRIKSIRAYKQ